MASAAVVYEGTADDMYIAAITTTRRATSATSSAARIAFYNDELYLRGADGKLAKIDAPNSANKSVHKDWLVLELREAYRPAARPTRPAA